MEIFDFNHMLDTFPGVWETLCRFLTERNVDYTYYEFVNCISTEEEYEITVKHIVQDFSLTLDMSRSEDQKSLELDTIRTW